MCFLDGTFSLFILVPFQCQFCGVYLYFAKCVSNPTTLSFFDFFFSRELMHFHNILLLMLSGQRTWNIVLIYVRARAYVCVCVRACVCMCVCVCVCRCVPSLKLTILNVSTLYSNTDFKLK
jgi:hypothetical protein